MKDLTPLNLSNWAKGIDRSKSDTEIGSNGLYTAENCFVSNAMVKKRMGYTELNSVALDTPDVISIYIYQKENGEEFILCNCGTDVYHVAADGSSTSIITGLLTAGNVMSYATVNNLVYMSNGFDNVYSWDGLAPAATALPALPKAKWLIVHGDKLFFIATAANPNYVYFSQAGGPEVIDTDAYFEVYTDDGDILTGAASFLGVLILFKNTSIHVLQGKTKAELSLTSNLGNIHPRIGCIAALSIVYVPGGVMFLSNDGVQFINGANISKQSDKVDPFLANIAFDYRQTSAAFWDGKNYRLSYVTGATDTTPNESLVYEEYGIYNALGSKEEHVPWVVFTYGMNAYAVTKAGTIYAAGNDGFLYTIDDDTSDNGAEIVMKVITGVFNFEAPFMTKIFRKAGINLWRSIATVNWQISIDRGRATYQKAFSSLTGLTYWGLNNWAISSGTVTVTNSSPDVVGDADADFTLVQAGDSFQVDGDAASYVVSVCDPVTKVITLTTNYTGTTGAGKVFVVWNDDTMFWTEPTSSYEQISLPKRLIGKNAQIQLLEASTTAEVEIYATDLRFLPLQEGK